MIKFWSYKREYQIIKSEILKNLNHTLSKGVLFFGEQQLKFEKNFGPKLGNLNLSEIAKIDEIDFVEKIHCVYKAIKKVSSDPCLKNKKANLQ